MAVIVGNRDVFPAELARRGRAEILEVLAAQGYDVVVLGPGDTPDGVVMTWSDAQRCAALFRQNAARIDGVLVTLPNFGDERAIADTLRLSGLTVPVFVHAWADRIEDLGIESRRDSFCGKLSTCNNLKQYGIPYTIGRAHVLSPRSPQFAEELGWFADVCRVVRGLRGLRVGIIGERTTPFKTVRFSEKLLEASGISVESKSLIDTVAEVNALRDDDPLVTAKLAKLTDYLPDTREVPAPAMRTTAKLGVVLESWMKEYGVSTYAIQCWSAMQGALKIFPCAIMSMMSDTLFPSACEADVMGAVAMYALQLAGGGATALFDWNNNFGDDPDKLVLFHCSNTPVSFMREAKAGLNAMAVKGNPRDSCFCTLHGALKQGPVAWARFSTDEEAGRIVGCIGDGAITADTIRKFGTTGVMAVPRLQDLLYVLATNGFEHHVALTYAPRTAALDEALGKYMGWRIYNHAGAPRPAAVL
ncbi:MAG TPA: fucose isomerase [Spirochaetia bacterium]